MDSTSKWIRLGHLPALKPEPVEECRLMTQEDAGLHHIARVMHRSPAPVQQARAALPEVELAT